MKRLGIILGLVFTSMIMQAQDQEGVTVTVTIENVLSDEGQIIGSLHTADTFMKAPGVQNKSKDASIGKVTLTFPNVKPGTFALMLMHDKNGNQRMDFEPSGMPKESYATSGDMAFGPPSFDGSKFEVADKDLEFRVRF
ncbi:DUF2141 domain-containing protein [Maribacter cobaltidurans]|uniref:Uncharacterized protein n=1 Tax=Maribacter cobaltidurans TaxID=1178778 RepID=A0A223V8R3_9FLAO|nr:DUF2141 domain-containing protein [Maribacter cobaltidurans]ASV31771.1 hypothetical protein CJ263_16975 [Maribacter cobaltidurans]GGD93191.1 hypothetical protein GCM10011412_33870 [Maribacter cobaltidurans]